MIAALSAGTLSILNEYSVVKLSLTSFNTLKILSANSIPSSVYEALPNSSLLIYPKASITSKRPRIVLLYYF